jgi:hypothetical protein
MRAEGRVIILMMAVSGDFDLPFKKHGIEDHGVRLLLLRRVVEESELYRYESAKHIIVDQSALLKYIDNSDKENVKRAFFTFIPCTQTCRMSTITIIVEVHGMVGGAPKPCYVYYSSPSKGFPYGGT